MKKLSLYIFFLFLNSLCYGQYYGQCCQDKFLNEAIFKNLKNGVFVEIGANDGVYLSNTYFFEKELGWNGLCVEPIPKVFAKLQNNRKCRCIQGCVSATKSNEARFLQITGPLEMLSGLMDKYDSRHMERIHRQLIEYGGQCDIIKLQTYTLNELLEKQELQHVNLLSIDTEGGELEILKSIDFSRYQIDVILVEDNYSDIGFKSFLQSKGFVFVKSLEQDLIFVNSRLNF